MRVCSLLPGATEIAFALGLGDDVVGVTHECDYPAAARQKPVVVCSLIESHRMTSLEIDRWVSERLRSNKSLYVIDEERLREAAPDVILTQGLCDVCAIDYDEVVTASETLAKKPKIVSLTPNRLADILDDVARIRAKQPDNTTKLSRSSVNSNSGFLPCATAQRNYPPVLESLVSNGSIQSTPRVTGSP